MIIVSFLTLAVETIFYYHRAVSMLQLDHSSCSITFDDMDQKEHLKIWLKQNCIYQTLVVVFFYERVPFDDLQVNRCIRHRQINLHTIVSYVHVVLQQHHEHI